VGDLAFDAKLLADYGEPPKHWLLRPMYAWRVLWRRRELKRALLVRREEAKRAAGEVEDLLVAVADQVRSDAEKRETFHVAIEHLRVAEDLLRSRDRVFAEEQDAQRARLTQFDSRLRALESELATAQAEERAIAADLAAVQAALARAETLRKRGDSMKRSAIVAGAERTGNERG
jgi:chromosome segregation ATPase